MSNKSPCRFGHKDCGNITKEEGRFMKKVNMSSSTKDHEKVAHKVSFADICIERAEKATQGPWVSEWDSLAIKNVRASDQTIIHSGFPTNSDFVANARTDVPELARRLKLAVKCLRQWAEMSPELKNDYLTLANDLESPLGDK